MCLQLAEQVAGHSCDYPEGLSGALDYVSLASVPPRSSPPTRQPFSTPPPQVPVRCGDGETLTELGWALLAERIHLLLVRQDWLLGAAYPRWNQSGSRGWELMGGRLLTGGIPGEAAVWGCSRPSTAPSVSPPPPPAAAAAALGSGNLRLRPGKPPPQGGAQLRGGLSARRGVCRVGAASWDQLVALENLPHTHTHTPLLCCRLPLQEQRQREDVCAPVRTGTR